MKPAMAYKINFEYQLNDKCSLKLKSSDTNMRDFCIFSLLCIILSCLSCSKRTDVSQQVVNVRMDNVKKCEDIISKMEILPLDTAKEAYMSSISRCVTDGESFFFVDRRGIIFLFGSDGRLVASSQHVYGQGNGEYSVCLCASYNKFASCFEVVTPLGMNIYDNKFKYVRTVHFPDEYEGTAQNRSFFAYIYDIDADTHLLMTSSIAPDPGHIFIYNSKTGKMEGDIKAAQKPFGITMQNNCISDADFFAMPWLDYSFYRIDLGAMRLTDCVRLDFGKDEIKESDIAGMDDEQRKAEFFMACKKPLPVRTFRSGETLVSMLKCGSRRSDFRLLLANVSTGENTVVDMNGGKFSMPFVESFVDGVLYCCATGNDIDKYVCDDLLDDNSKKIKESLGDDGNVVILKYHLKK